MEEDPVKILDQIYNQISPVKYQQNGYKYQKAPSLQINDYRSMQTKLDKVRKSIINKDKLIQNKNNYIDIMSYLDKMNKGQKITQFKDIPQIIKPLVNYYISIYDKDIKKNSNSLISYWALLSKQSTKNKLHNMNRSTAIKQQPKYEQLQKLKINKVQSQFQQVKNQDEFNHNDLLNDLKGLYYLSNKYKQFYTPNFKKQFTSFTQCYQTILNRSQQIVNVRVKQLQKQLGFHPNSYKNTLISAFDLMQQYKDKINSNSQKTLQEQSQQIIKQIRCMQLDQFRKCANTLKQDEDPNNNLIHHKIICIVFNKIKKYLQLPIDTTNVYNYLAEIKDKVVKTSPIMGLSHKQQRVKQSNKNVSVNYANQYQKNKTQTVDLVNKYQNKIKKYEEQLHKLNTYMDKISVKIKVYSKDIVDIQSRLDQMICKMQQKQKTASYIHKLFEYITTQTNISNHKLFKQTKSIQQSIQRKLRMSLKQRLIAQKQIAKKQQQFIQMWIQYSCNTISDHSNALFGYQQQKYIYQTIKHTIKKNITGFTLLHRQTPYYSTRSTLQQSIHGSPNTILLLKTTQESPTVLVFFNQSCYQQNSLYQKPIKILMSSKSPRSFISKYEYKQPQFIQDGTLIIGNNDLVIKKDKKISCKFQQSNYFDRKRTDSNVDLFGEDISETEYEVLQVFRVHFENQQATKINTQKLLLSQELRIQNIKLKQNQYKLLSQIKYDRQRYYDSLNIKDSEIKSIKTHIKDQLNKINTNICSLPKYQVTDILNNYCNEVKDNIIKIQNKYNQKLTQKQKTIQQLRQQINNLNTKVTNTNTLNQLHSEIQRLQGQNVKFQRDIDRHVRSIKALKNRLNPEQLTKYQQSQRITIQQFNKLKEECRHKTERYEQLQKQLKQYKQQQQTKNKIEQKQYNKAQHPQNKQNTEQQHTKSQQIDISKVVIQKLQQINFLSFSNYQELQKRSMDNRQLLMKIKKLELENTKLKQQVDKILITKQQQLLSTKKQQQNAQNNQNKQVSKTYNLKYQYIQSISIQAPPKQITNYQVQTQQNQETIQFSEEDKQKLNKLCTDLQNKSKKLQSEIKQKNQKLQQIQKNIFNNERQSHQKRQALRAANQQTQKQNKILKQVKQHNQQLIRMIEVTKKNKQQIQIEYQTLAQKLEKLKEQQKQIMVLIDNKVDIKNKNNIIQELQKCYKQQQLKLQTKKEQLSKLQQQIKRKQEQLQLLGKNITEQPKVEQKVQQKIEQQVMCEQYQTPKQNKNDEELQKELSAKKQDIQNMNRQVQQIRKNIQILKKDNQQNQIIKNKLNQQLEQLNNEIKGKRQENDQLDEKYEELMDQIAKLQMKSNTLKTKNEKDRTRMLSVPKPMQKIQENKLKDLQQRYDNKVKDFDEIKKKLSLKEYQLRKANEKIDKLNKTVELNSIQTVNIDQQSLRFPRRQKTVQRKDTKKLKKCLMKHIRVEPDKQKDIKQDNQIRYQHMIKQLSPQKQKNINLYQSFNGKIKLKMQQKLIIHQQVQKTFSSSGYYIKSTQLLYFYPSMKKLNFHPFVDNRRNIIVVIKLKDVNHIIVTYSQPELSITPYKPEKNVGAFIAVINNEDPAKNNKICYLNTNNPQARPMIYNDYYLVIGNSDLRIKGGESKAESNIPTTFQYFNTHGADSPEFMFGKKDRQAQVESYQIYQLELLQSEPYSF